MKLSLKAMTPVLVVPVSGLCLRFYIMLTCPCDVDPLTPHFYIKTVSMHYADILKAVKRIVLDEYKFYFLFLLKT